MKQATFQWGKVSAQRKRAGYPEGPVGGGGDEGRVGGVSGCPAVGRHGGDLLGVAAQFLETLPRLRYRQPLPSDHNTQENALPSGSVNDKSFLLPMKATEPQTYHQLEKHN